MAFAIKAEINDPAATTFAFVAQKTMYGGKHIAAGDTIFLFASENEGGRGLVASGIVTSARAVAKKRGIARQTPRVSITVKRTALARRPLGRTESQASDGLERRAPRDRAQLQILPSSHEQNHRRLRANGGIPGQILLVQSNRSSIGECEGGYSVSRLSKIKASFGKARESLSGVQALGRARKPITPEVWEEVEELLLLADFGVPTTEKIVGGLRTVAKQELWATSDQIVARFRKDVERFLTLPGAELNLSAQPAVLLVVGVNGSGKTTTIGKLATALRAQGKRVLLVAADTFRAAAAEQLAVWAERSGADYLRGKEGADPASVVFDGVAAGKARGADVIIIDTAGRLQTKTNLMEELKKMRRIVERELGAAPAETLLVLDGTTGQNAISQAKLFNEATSLTGAVVTKLDSTAKGGVLVAIVDTLEIPIKYVGLGESADALRPFSPGEFIEALFEESDL